ncbi:MAG: extracellular solute-binding protein [Alphaproteobacteria bacterium]|nr:extracellular solute-binding protein [Alphaproteobacteria bacterium]
MREEQTFAQDCAELLRDELAAGRIDRRTFLRGLAALGIAPAALAGSGLLAGEAAAQGAKPKEVVLANFGGDAVPAFTEAFAKPFEAQQGVKMVIDGSGPTTGKIKAMVDARKVIWDIIDSGTGQAYQLGEAGYLEPIDYSIVDKKKLDPEFAYKWGVINYYFSTVLAWDSSKIQGTPTYADFFDVKKIPGKRMLRRTGLAMLEPALIADGVAPDKLYPIDQKRALAKVGSIKADSLYWNSGAESQQLMRTGECVMGLLWHTRANVLERDTGGRIKWTFAQAILQPGIWIIPKNPPAGAAWANRAINAMQEPAGQVLLLDRMGNGPANPAAASLVKPEANRANPAAPENIAKQIKFGGEWWMQNQEQLAQAFLDLISS